MISHSGEKEEARLPRRVISIISCVRRSFSVNPRDETSLFKKEKGKNGDKMANVPWRGHGEISGRNHERCQRNELRSVGRGEGKRAETAPSGKRSKEVGSRLSNPGEPMQQEDGNLGKRRRPPPILSSLELINDLRRRFPALKFKVSSREMKQKLENWMKKKKEEEGEIYR